MSHIKNIKKKLESQEYTYQAIEDECIVHITKELEKFKSALESYIDLPFLGCESYDELLTLLSSRVTKNIYNKNKGFTYS